jgi:methylenetetrahydrofolate reductase (NADPH)
MPNRYEILPFGTAEADVRATPGPLAITVTCSPRHGLDHSVDVATRVAAAGHQAILHLAAREVRDAAHLDAVLERLAGSGLDDVFVIGGDGHEAAGPYSSAVELLPVIAEHRRRPRRIGIGAYPEGHPLIEPATLVDALRRKARLADYLVTQLCFDPQALLRWLEATRADGIDLPLYVGIPGAVDRRRLLEVSMRVGVGTSIAFLRKQRGLRHLLGRGGHAADGLYDAFAPLVGDRDLGIAGLHFFTFNRLQATLAWEAERTAPHRSIATTTTGAATS